MTARTRHLAVFAGFLVGAVVFVWPLPTRIGTHITGDTSGDAGAYVWNLYSFQRNLERGGPMFTTDRILMYTPESSLALHNNAFLTNAAASLLVPAFGVIASFNLTLIGIVALNPFCAYILAWRETRQTVPSVLAGVLFGFSPFVSARVEGHTSLATAFILPLLVLATRRALERERLSDWLAVGVCFVLAAFSDPYYLIFGALATAALVTAHATSWVPREEGSRDGVTTRFFLVVAGVAACLAIAISSSGGFAVPLGWTTLGLRGLHTPVLVATVALIGAGLAGARLRPRLELRGPQLLRPAIAAAFTLALLSPWITAAASELSRAGAIATPLWRSSPQGVDALSLIAPNPTHPLLRGPLEDWLTREREDGFMEGVGSLSATGLLGLLFLLRAGAAAPRLWIGFSALFALLALGPFLRVAGELTYVPGPWALLRFVPFVGMVRSPGRFVVLATLGLAIAVAVAAADLRPGRARRFTLAALFAALGCELLPIERRLFDTAIPPSYQLVARDRCDIAVLRLPTGLRDGTRQRGQFSSRAQFRQIFHGKRMLGGYLSRLGDETISAYERHPTLRVLLDLSEGRPVDAVTRAAGVAEAPRLAAQLRIGFLLLNRAETSEELRRFAREAFGTRRISRGPNFDVLLPYEGRCAGGRCAHDAACEHRAAEPDVSRGSS